MYPIQRALLSVSDKTGIVEFARELHKRGVEILSTGGTAKALKEAEIPVVLISDYTGFPEMLDGRVKTLNPKIHGGILGLRDNSAHQKTMEEHGIKPIDLVAINLYPFEATISKPDATLEEAIENIDIGGPAMVRSASKNHQSVAIVVNPTDYQVVLQEMDGNNNSATLKTRRRLARDAFQHTSRYDGLIQNYLTEQIGDTEEEFPQQLNLIYEKVQSLRYGENPHQTAAFYKRPGNQGEGITSAEKLQGKELSFNNIVDLQSAYDLVREFEETTAVIIKHTNPCGAASDPSLLSAFIKAREVDSVSAFGGIIGLNKTVDEETAQEITKNFVEAVIAPDFSPEALVVFSLKKNIRLLKLPLGNKDQKDFEIKNISGGILVQETDSVDCIEDKLRVVTKRQPSEEEWSAMRFAWKVAKHVKSNAIIYAFDNQTIGVGAGQMSRVDSSKIAISKATHSIKGAVMASDAFFPFRDAIEAAAEQGIAAIIQPGGSIRDKDIIEAANELNIAMVFTGIRHFKH